MYFLGSEVSINFFLTSILFWGVFGSILNWFVGPTKKDLLGSVQEGFKRAIVLGGIVFLLGAVFSWFKPTQPEGTFTASAKTVQVAQEPLQFDVDFAPSKSEPTITNVTTDIASFSFSSHGATLVDAVFSRELSGGRSQAFAVWKQEYFTEKNQYPFMVGLDQHTPYEYELIDQKNNASSVVLTYKGYSDQGTIIKEFTVHKDTSVIDLALTLEPRKTMRPRIMWVNPMLKELGEYDAINAVACTKTGKFVITSSGKIDATQGYIQPEIYGSDNKYFLCALVKDADKFVDRAYSQKVNESVVSYLEGQEVSETTTWNMSFYFGPKELEPLIAVDRRLEKVLDYGWFSFITKPMLSILKYCDQYTHNYGYAILLVTLLLKLLLLPFTFRGDKKMREFQESQKKLEYIEKKYKDNPELLQQAKAEHAMKNGMTMLGGCLPQFVQMPFFLGLQGALRNSLELYEQPFLWIKDLSVPDTYYILPLLMFLSFIVSFLVNNATQKTKGVRGLLFPISIGMLMGGVGTIMASGLGLYLLFNNVLHVVQVRIQRAFGV